MYKSKLAVNKFIREEKIERLKLIKSGAIGEEIVKDSSQNIEKSEKEHFSLKKTVNVKFLGGIKKRYFVAIGSLAAVLVMVGAGVIIGQQGVEEAKAIKEYERQVAELEKEIEIADQALDAMEKEVDVITHSEIWEMDLSQPSGVTAEELAPLLQGGTVGLEDAFIEAEKTHDVNALFLVSIAALESAWGTINFRPNNMFGYGTSGYASKEDNIMAVAEGLGSNYLHPSGSLYSGTTATAVNARYATSTQWDDKVVKQMAALYDDAAVIQQENLDALIAAETAEIKVLEEELELIKSEEKKREKYWLNIDSVLAWIN